MSPTESSPVANALREYAFWLERELGDPRRIQAYRQAADVAAQHAGAHAAWTQPHHWQRLPKFGPSTAAFATDIVQGRTPERLASARARGAHALDPAGMELRARLRGDLHVHTTWSDGGSPLWEMALTAEALGHDYMAITDHSPRLRVANGLSPERLAAQWSELAEVQAERSIRLLRGIEVDILAGGELDQAEHLLAATDVVVASVHSGLRDDAETMTRRLVTAIANPHTTVLGHCTGRKRRSDGSWREPSDFDADIVFGACVMFGVAVEINSRPERRDPPMDLLRCAHQAGCLFAIDTDAHAPGQLDFQTYGAARAAAAGIGADRIINSWDLDRLLAHSYRRRHAARYDD
ncbi:MAG: PHP domain-containing protein [Arachnia sp.]